MKAWPILLALALAACAPRAPAPEPSARPTRIVSLDYCADQYVLRLAGRERILALSPDAEKPESYMRAHAAGLPKVRPLAEDVLALRPDLVVRTYGGGPNAPGFFAAAGVPVLQIGYARDLAGLSRLVREAGEGLGEVEKAEALADEIEVRLAALDPSPHPRAALYMTPGGVTSGPGSLVHQMLTAAGLQNFQQEQGWRPIPLERLAYQQPDLVAAAFFNEGKDLADFWGAMGHPVAKQQLKERPVVWLQGAWTACGGWFLLDAVEALAAAP